MQPFCREIGQELLERAEADGALIKILVCFRLLEADGVLYEVVDAPVCLLCMQIACAIARSDQRQDTARIIRFCTQEFGDGRDILHQARHVAKRMVIDFLQDIAAAAGRHGQIRRVDMAVLRIARSSLLRFYHNLAWKSASFSNPARILSNSAQNRKTCCLPGQRRIRLKKKRKGAIG